MNLKNKLYIIAMGCTLFTFLACEDLNTAPDGYTVTTDQKKDASEADPALLEGDANGMFASIGAQFCVYGASSARDDDFGYPSDCLSEGLNSGDMVTPPSDYDWFSGSSTMNDRSYNYANPEARWRIYYNQIKAANDILAVIDPNTEKQELKYYIGLAKAVRAFDYLQLVQAYSLTYNGHTNDPAIPVYLAENQELSSARQSVSFVYEVIINDLNDAISKLEGYSRPSKSYINQAVAYGLRARANLLMNKWEEAASDAQNAINMAKAEGLAPVGIQEASKVGRMFINKDETNWMWGMTFDPSAINTDMEYQTWVSQYSSLVSYSYTAEAGCYRRINSQLWNTISGSDVRKGWWVDKDLTSPIIEGLTWTHKGVTVPLGKATGDLLGFEPYTNVKFGAYQGVMGTTTTAGDFPMMRVEEMYLILAEAQGRSSEATGTYTLQNFIKEYRDASYTYIASNFIDEIWRQRRIELWGEGFAMKDILRLKKPLVRASKQSSMATNTDKSCQFNIQTEDGWLLMRIPQVEINGNNSISDSDNNNGGKLPSQGDNSSLEDGVTNLH